MLPQRISSIHSSVCQIHAKLHHHHPLSDNSTTTTIITTNNNNSGSNDVENGTATAAVNGNASATNLSQSLGRLTAKLLNNNRNGGNSRRSKKNGGESLCCSMRKQLFCAQCLKLLALFTVAITHVLFLHPFLELFSQLDNYAAQVDIATATLVAASAAASAQPQEYVGIGTTGLPSSALLATNLLRHSVHELAEYKKNIWMTVAVLCVALSTSSFFLFLLPSTISSPIQKRHVYLVGLVDAISFGCLPLLFFARISIVQLVHEQLGRALEQAHRISSAEKLMNEAQCSIQPREKLPFCSELIMRSVFPADLLKFLLVLCVMTLAYLLVAYIIYWCIKHWIPQCGTSTTNNTTSNGKFRHCCRFTSCSSSSSPPSSWHGSPALSLPNSYVALSQQAEKVAPLFVGCSPLSLVVPNPLMAVPSPPSQCSPVSLSGTGNEQIPIEPTPQTMQL